MKVYKKISWCWSCGNALLSVDGSGIDIRNAFDRLSKSEKHHAMSNMKWIEINGKRI